MSEVAVAADVAELERLDPADREVAVTSMLDQSRQWLDRAMASTTPAQDVAEFKAFVATVAEAAKQKKLSEAIQLDAVEMVRRSERALGVAIRKGQDAGEVARSGDIGGIPPNASTRSSNRDDLVRPSEFFGHAQERADTYAMTDGVTDEQFEAALSDAKEEGNLSRANVVRKVTQMQSFREKQDEKWDRVGLLANSGLTSAQIAREVGMGEQGVRKGAKSRGLKITNNKSENSVGAVTSLKRVYDLGGPQLLVRTLYVIREAWNGSGFEAAMLDGLGKFIARYQGRYVEETLIRKLSRIKSGVDAVSQKAHLIRERTGASVREAHAAAITEIYNQGARGTQSLGSWFKDA